MSKSNIKIDFKEVFTITKTEPIQRNLSSTPQNTFETSYFILCLNLMDKAEGF